MPTYDYECDACGHKFELFQSITADPEKKCPECKKKKLRRLIGPGAAIVFKGSGFYTTDYRSDSYKKRAEADKPASSDKGGSGGEKTSKSEKSAGGEKSSGGKKGSSKGD
ncbi:MAG: zinc ribbon domain-containing protein [Pirellulales bacterium]|nr:zinc ribbon domain-containing protein [Pirellulales bacterium]